MRTLFRFAGYLMWALFALCPTDARSPEALKLNIDFKESVTEVAPGLVHVHLFSSKSQDRLPLNIHMLKIDLRKILVKPVLAMDQILGQETTSSMAIRYNALAGINGGFSFSNDPWNIYHGDPSGFLVIDGKILSEPTKGRSSFGIYTSPNYIQIPFIDRPNLKTRLLISESKVKIIKGINRKRNKNDFILYTPEWGRSTITDQTGVEIVIEGNKVVAVHIGKGSSLIPVNGIVLSATGEDADWLMENISPGENAEVIHELTSLNHPGVPLPLENHSYINAGPVLMADGVKFTDYEKERFDADFSIKRHPRTAIGISKDKKSLLFVVVDGRQPELSVGMSLEELTDFIAGQGAHHIYNLDGGGSTTMVVKGKVVNSYSDRLLGVPCERRRCDAILLFQRSAEAKREKIIEREDSVSLSLYSCRKEQVF